jgi:DNA primase
MALISKQSLEILKEKVDLVEVIASFIKLVRSGSHYKGLCPFHNEKTPSFSLSQGDKHYHCFGCGAHGDVIAFLMEYSKMSFNDALSYLAERYQVSLETEDQKDPSAHILKKQIKEALMHAEDFYSFCMLYTYEGDKALKYAISRKMDQTFIEDFKVGYSPKNNALFRYLKSLGYTDEVMKEAGLYLSEKKHDFFHDRFMIPIHDPMGACIGFTARKLDEESFGGKYINTPETILFKKSHVLFGLKQSRAKIIKEKKALICEGQIDCMRLIHSGFDWACASQGTAFGQAHVQMLKKLGITQAYLAFDGDHAGIQAAIKVGELFMQALINVHVLPMPNGKDPDSFILENGKDAFSELIHHAQPYLEFLYNTQKNNYNIQEPAEKNRLIYDIKRRIEEFKDPILVHESLKKLAELAEIPERLLGINTHKSVKLKNTQELLIDKDLILEKDFIRLFYLSKAQNLGHAKLFEMNKIELKNPELRSLYEAILTKDNLEMIHFMAHLDPNLVPVFETLFEKKINRLKLFELSKECILKLLERAWLDEQNLLRKEIELAQEEKDQLKLTLKMTLLLKNPPKLQEG